MNSPIHYTTFSRLEYNVTNANFVQREGFHSQ